MDILVNLDGCGFHQRVTLVGLLPLDLGSWPVLPIQNPYGFEFWGLNCVGVRSLNDGDI